MRTINYLGSAFWLLYCKINYPNLSTSLLRFKRQSQTSSQTFFQAPSQGIIIKRPFCIVFRGKVLNRCQGDWKRFCKNSNLRRIKLAVVFRVKNIFKTTIRIFLINQQFASVLRKLNYTFLCAFWLFPDVTPYFFLNSGHIHLQNSKCFKHVFHLIQIHLSLVQGYFVP